MTHRPSRMIIVAAGCGVSAVILAILLTFRVPRGIELSPNTIVPTTVPIEGEMVTHRMTLRNPNLFAVRLKNVDASCGCSTIVHRGGEEVKVGEVLPPRAAMDLEVTVNTMGQVSPRQVRVAIEAARLDGRTVPGATARIDVPVKAGPRVEPMALIFRDVMPEKEASRELIIADGQDHPVQIKEIKFSDPDHFSGRLIPADASERRIGKSMKLAHRLVVTYRSSQPVEMGNAFVELVPLQSRFAPLRVPIYVRSSKVYTGFVPEKLVVVVRAGETSVKRNVMLRTGSGSAEVKLVSHPSFVNVNLGHSSGDEREIELSIDVAALTAAQEDQVVVVSVGEGKEHTLPIKALAVQ